ncbi:MAG: hypothetical protein K8F52_10450 [Candidatus Scalindua rubra]|uniref:Uncharacterized protein n=1 Tax=Candidatus Scalindua brodae TaxID=237368 RepID=A0A0B0EL07_9BACT|nr:MAG: hypothetical protein SCABRO_02916 [Candidatus Scalindua brodae]MBZ0109079.1 hypothetical protein [Candidatus Scalindua rubra]
MRRSEESQKSKFEQSVTIGEDNAEEGIGVKPDLLTMVVRFVMLSTWQDHYE